MMRILFGLYQWLVAFPILVVITLLTAVSTILFAPWPNTKVAYFPARTWSRIFCAMFLIRVKVEGLEHIDSKQSYVFASNHQSIFDVFVIYGWLPLYFKWIMKAELRKIPFVGRACESAGHIFINRKNPKAAQRSIEFAQKQLQNGVSVVVFPEGTRTANGEVGGFKRGAFVLATDLCLPIVPISLSGCYHCWPRNSWFIMPGQIRMQVHPPIQVEPFLPNHQKELIESVRAAVVSGVTPS